MIKDLDLLTDELLNTARSFSVKNNVSLIKSIKLTTNWSPEKLLVVLGHTFGYPIIFLTELLSYRPDFDSLSYTDCLQRGVLIALDTVNKPTIILSDPFDAAVEDWILRKYGFTKVAPNVVLVLQDDLNFYLSQQENQLRATQGFEVDERTQNDEEVAATITLTTISEETSSVVKLVNSTIYDAIKLQASDIHLECDAGCFHISCRIDGVLVPLTQVQGQSVAEQVISRIKVMADLDISERRIPQDGRFKVRVNSREIDFRVSIMPNIFGEDAVLRLLDRQSVTEESKSLRLDHLGLNELSITAIRRLAKKPHGMLLVTGPTGSGKTTTLYAAITEIHSGREKIITIEDPVEYRIPRILQIPVNEKKGLTFAKGLRSILRHDPDKIMVGEIRDGETAQIAVQAALTGHLVLTTVHANNVFDVLGRFLHMGVDAYSFAAALNGIVAQRLLRINCAHCIAIATPSEIELDTLGISLAQVSGWTFKKSLGCAHCRGVGYKGRKAVSEVLVLDDTMREMIVDKVSISNLKEHARKLGLRSLRDTALDWVSRGETTLEEVIRVAG